MKRIELLINFDLKVYTITLYFQIQKHYVNVLCE